ncbi:MAG: hypothetical protein JWN47_964 [Frankiales bacterium]|nr:hypothetical protein [Frankiales bacterium]
MLDAPPSLDQIDQTMENTHTYVGLFHRGSTVLGIRLARDTARLVGVTCALLAALATGRPHSFGWDSRAYWLAWHGTMYGGAPMTRDAYLYSPAFAQAIRPVAYLGWPVFAVMWSALLTVVLAWLLLPLRWWAIPLWLASLPEIISGNVFVLLAAVAALGVRHQWVWAFAALTKITPCLGPVWFAVRREWRHLGISLVATAAMAVLSLAVAPQLWSEWIQFLFAQANKSGHTLGAEIWPPVSYRLPLAILLVAWGARTSRPWVLPVGMVFASPVIWLGTFTMLAALPRLRAPTSSGIFVDPRLPTPLKRSGGPTLHGEPGRQLRIWCAAIGRAVAGGSSATVKRGWPARPCNCPRSLRGSSCPTHREQ